MSGYDTALTVFSPNGHLFQVEYATEAVNQGLTSIGIRFNNGIVLAVEKKTQSKLQIQKKSKKIILLDQNLVCAFSGLNADARILLNMTRVHCQSYRLNYDDSPTANQVAQYVAGIQQKHTQKGGVRPYGVATLISGFDSDNRPRLYQTDPSGFCSEWNAACVGKGQKQILEFMEKNYEQNLNQDQALLLACKALNGVVESIKTNVDICIITFNNIKYLNDEELNKLSDLIVEA